MQTIAIIELVSAVFLAILLIGRGAEFGNSTSSRRLRFCTILNLVALVIDAMAYIFMGPGTPFAFRYLICLWAFIAGGVNALAFAHYSEAFIAQKTSLKPVLFSIMKIAVAIWITATAALFFAGKLLVFENGVEVANYGFPLTLNIYQIAVMLYMPVVAFFHRKKIGNEAFFLLSFFFITPIIGLIFAAFIVDDYSYLFSAVSLFFVSEFLQKKQVQEQQAELSAHEALSENSARFFALEDNFESLYDVELESGHYDVFVKGDFYRSNVQSKLNLQGDFFDALRTNIDTVVCLEDREALFNALSRESIRNVLSTAEHFDYHYRLNINNELVWFRIRIVYKNANKKNVIIGIFNASEEMASKEKEAKAKRQATELSSVKRSLNMMFALSDQFDPIMVLDPDTGKYEWLMGKATEIDQLTSMVVHGDDFYKDNAKDIDTIIHEEDKTQFRAFYTKENMMQIAETGKAQETENRWKVGPNKTYLWKYNKAVRMLDENGKAYVVVGVIDTTEAKKKEEQFQEAYRQLNEANQRNLLLYDITNAIKWTYNIGPDDKIISYSYADQAEKLIDSNNFEDPMAWIEVVHPDDKERALEAFNAVIHDRSGKTPYEITYRIKGVNGNYVWLKVAGRVIVGEDGIRELFGISVDVTDQMEEERRRQNLLQEALQAADSANKAKTNFLFNMSHDIRTPMNAITGFTHMAIKHIDDKEKAIDCLEKIQKSGSMLLSLINSVLEVSRIESGNAKLEEQPGDIFYCFINIENTLQELAKTKDITLTFEFGDIKDQYVYADFSRCMRIFVNVISNAIKYTHEGGAVKVHCEQVGEAKDGYATYQYTVTDNGIGMSEEFQKHVFEQFTRENTATVSGIQGTGLGMSVVKSFVELMGGTVSVKSKQGEGTTFTINLPFKLQKGENYTDPVSGEIIGTNKVNADTSVMTHFTGKKVLLVEDNELNREIAVELLTDEGLSVEEAEDGSIAVKMLKQKGNEYYDFILMDIQMPIMGGYEATKLIRAGGFTRPIIALSANAFAEDKAASLAAGMNDHVAKPINMKELLAALAKH